MHKLLLIALLGLVHPTLAAQDDPPEQIAEQEQVSQNVPEPTEDVQDDGSDLIAAEVSETNDVEEESESSVRFIPTEEISQDLGVSFPVNI